MQDPFYELIHSLNEEIANFSLQFDSAICIADDVLDHKIEPRNILDVLLGFNQAFKLFSKYPDFYPKLQKSWEILLYAEQEDLNFVPLKKSNEEELLVWVRRGFRASISFDCLCFVDPTFETEENRQWIIQTQTAGLILNDCSDFIKKEFEDLIQCRRNYIVLKYFDQSIYFNWRNKKDILIQKAEEVFNAIEFIKPKDERLQIVYQNICKLK